MLTYIEIGDPIDRHFGAIVAVVAIINAAAVAAAIGLAASLGWIVVVAIAPFSLLAVAKVATTQSCSLERIIYELKLKTDDIREIPRFAAIPRDILDYIILPMTYEPVTPYFANYNRPYFYHETSSIYRVTSTITRLNLLPIKTVGRIRHLTIMHHASRRTTIMDVVSMKAVLISAKDIPESDWAAFAAATRSSKI